jgi:hypothetical protein
MRETLEDDIATPFRLQIKSGNDHEHLSSGSFRQIVGAWMREQGDWAGARAVTEDWVLLEGRPCEIARAEAHCNLQQAREKGTICDYLQSLQRRGHVGLANAGLETDEGDARGRHSHTV